MHAIEIIKEYYRPGSKAYEIMLRHGEDVARKSVEISSRVASLNPDVDFILEAAKLHDIAIFLTNAPDIGCTGRHPYICHGYLGREILEGLRLPRHAMVCERHVGVGITAEDVRTGKLPLPERDMIPVSIEEKIVCYADKFFSKSSLRTGEEKSVEEVVSGIARYGQEKVAIFQVWLKFFGP
ncbi:MAG: phosphohydrolase [Acidobacteriota bacterium]